MSFIKPKNITAWSYSRVSTYKQCPFKLKQSAIERVKEPPSPAMERGDAIHKAAEAYLKGATRALPKDLKPLGDEVKRIKGFVKAGKGEVEKTWAFKRDWSATTWDDWRGCWLRIKVDVAHFENDDLLIITDWKTGKFRQDNLQDYLEQIELYQLGALLTYSHIRNLKVVARLAYTDQGIFYPSIEEGMVAATAHHLPILQRAWEKRVKPMLKDEKFAPKRNRYCGSCFYRASNKANGGGQCIY